MAEVHVITGRKAYNLNLESSGIFSRMIRPTKLPRYLRCSDLHDLAREGDLLTAEIFVDKGGLVDYLNGEGKTPLHEAAFFGHIEIAKFLISRGAVIDVTAPSFGHTPLYLAVSGGYLDMVQFLLSCGANVHAKDGLTGQGLLHLAASSGDARMLGILIEQGIDVLLEDRRGQTARDYAVRARHEDMERVLLKVMAHHASKVI